MQLAFWGNPITSASHQVDYFISSDAMEHPYRTHLKDTDEPYTEQVVLLDGQGIWYYHPNAPQMKIPSGNKFSHLKAVPVSRSDYDLGEEWFIFFCPQSVFKMHPLFDFVFADILRQTPNAHVVVTSGRRTAWTKRYELRLEMSLGPELMDRMHILQRISSEKFLNLLQISDVLLHPFPFDGSRTSADGIGVGIPVLTLPAEYLRGRMCQAFYRTMDMPELVAKNRSHYVSIANQLATNKKFYLDVLQKVKHREHLIWEDMEVPFMWSSFLSRVTGAHTVPWGQYLYESGRDIGTENQLKQERDRNREQFFKSWGSEGWLLGANAVAMMEGLPRGFEVPFIFSDWGQNGVVSPPLLPSFRDDTVSLNVDSELQNTELSKRETLRYHGHHRDEIYKSSILHGHSRAAEVALKYYNHYSTDKVFLSDLGSLEYLSGNYSASTTHCRIALAYDPEFLNGLVCVGVSELYLRNENEAIRYLEGLETNERFGKRRFL